MVNSEQNSQKIMIYSLLTIHYSQIIPGISFRGLHILPHISPKGQYHINNNRRADGKQGRIHKVLPDLAGGDTHPGADG
jgi:hypothetical protein